MCVYVYVSHQYSGEFGRHILQGDIRSVRRWGMRATESGQVYEGRRGRRLKFHPTINSLTLSTLPFPFSPNDDQDDALHVSDTAAISSFSSGFPPPLALLFRICVLLCFDFSNFWMGCACV
jgi:hypothetical protein